MTETCCSQAGLGTLSFLALPPELGSASPTNIRPNRRGALRSPQQPRESGLRAGQAKANLDPHEWPHEWAREWSHEWAQESAHESARGLIFPLLSTSRTAHENSHETFNEGVHGSAHESVHSSGRGSPVLFSSVMFLDQREINKTNSTYVAAKQGYIPKTCFPGNYISVT